MSTQQTEPTGRAGRYQRSAAGLVVSLLVTVLALGGVLYFMGAFRHDLDVRPEQVDHLDIVAAAQQAGLKPIYPADLPDGWIATGVDVVPGDDPAFTIRMLTDDERFVGVHQEDASSTALLARWVDEETQTADAYEVPRSVMRPVARHWDGYTDEGGDHAYVATVGDDTVIVFGSADAEELQAIVDALVRRPVG
ncbi:MULTISPECIES: DUF4245 family protein [Nocardioides]|uniref:DUF4245 family protein n=1 Tax=Nocardioides vastitatis TaxID=2568655 RepID=A0ABW0Z9B6_9ACTN|nr:DUF4245 family protein [Nocardioides sp.]THJ09602.1 DUF4245 family protein [Nocardioides sp.]